MVADEEQEPRDEIEVIRSELEVARQEREALTRTLESRDAAIVRLEQALVGKESEVCALTQTVAEAERKLAEISEALAQAVASYKALVVTSNPGVLEELITGSTVEEVDASLKSARTLVERVKQEIEVEASRTKVPAGAPQRAPLDLSALSSREKIQYAIGGKR